MAKFDVTVSEAKVELNDTLWDIAEEVLKKNGNPHPTNQEINSTVKKIAAKNDISDPDYIVAGSTIVVGDNTTVLDPNQYASKVTITGFGLKASNNSSGRTLILCWSWARREETKEYKVIWEYNLSYENASDNSDKTVWYTGKTETLTVDKDAYASSQASTFDIPDGAIKVQVKVKPVREKDDKKSGWEWSGWQKFTVADEIPPENPTGLEVEIKDYKLTATIRNIDVDVIDYVQFRVRKENESITFKQKTVNVKKTVRIASTSFDVSPGIAYVVEYRVSKGKVVWSEWSDTEGPYYTAPSAPTIKDLKAVDETKVYISWSAVDTADKYDIRYANEKANLETPGDGTTSVSTTDDAPEYTFTSLEPGKTYFFQVRAVNDGGESEWSDIRQIIIGEQPSPPTTWSSVSTVVIGEVVYLYWVHNSSDESSQSEAIVRIRGTEKRIIVDKDDAEENVTGMITLTTSSSGLTLSVGNGKFKDTNTNTTTIPGSISSGASISWCVRTIGVSPDKPSDWSTERTVTVYSRPTLTMYMRDKDNNEISVLNSFPIEIMCVPEGGSNQSPISYNISITADESYETVNNVGNEVTITAGTVVYSKHFDGFDPFGTTGLVLTPGDVSLENNASYVLRATVFMDSGLTADAEREFTVAYESAMPSFFLDAGIVLNTETVTTTIVPYCEHRKISYYKVNKIGNAYYTTNEELGSMYMIQDSSFSSAIAVTGETVYYGTSSIDGKDYYYHEVRITENIQNMLLSVYRREFDGSFTELSKDLPSENWTAVVDPHPALDYARYRIVAKSNETSEITYYDLPAYEIGIKYVIIQWDEVWSAFDYTDRHEIARSPWGGSFLKLPYNIDVSDSYDADVTLVNYIGRENPVTYYGTQIGHTATWDISIDKTDVETIYGLRRLARWMGDVYVREPSGSGYWANIRVSFNQKHTDPIVPVSLDITRVDGGA